MTRPRPTIAEAYAKHLAAFNRHTPFGVLLPSDLHALIRCVARDARVSVEAAVAGILLRKIGQAVARG